MKLAAIKIHGGKQHLAKEIVKLFPPRCKTPNNPDPNDDGYIHMVEPYFGGGAVLLANDPEGISEVANDIDDNLMNFWYVLQGQTSFNQFRRLVEAVPFGKPQYDEAAENSVFTADGYGHSVHLAATFFVRCRQSLAGRMKGFTGITRTRTRRGVNEQVSAWLNAVEGLPAVHERIKRVLILKEDALDVIRKEDGKRTLFYLDPPYLHITRTTTGEYGGNEMSEVAHFDLLNLLSTIKGRFLLSGYHSDLYDAFAKTGGWTCHEFNVPNSAAGGKKKRRMTECVWTNF